MNSSETKQLYIDTFNEAKITHKTIDKSVHINISFINNPTVEIKGNSDDKFKIEFIDGTQTIHQSIITCNMWTKVNRSYFTKWKIRITNVNTDVVLYDKKMDLTGKRVLISFESKSLGDTLAWFPYVEEFRKKHNCKVIVSTFLNFLFKEQYSEIDFIEPGSVVDNLHAKYRLGWFYENGEYNRYLHPSDFKKLPLQKTATDILGLEYREIRPNLSEKFENRNSKIVGIAIHSTAQTKYWNNKKGWQEVVDYLISKEYQVVLYSKENDGYMGNYQPKGVTKVEGTLVDIMKSMSKCEFFIGIGSGLSWLSWSIGLPTFIISGFSEEYTETKSNTFRIINKSVCHGCFNNYKFDPGDWNWCPVHKGTDRQFECTKTISSDMVIEEIGRFLEN